MNCTTSRARIGSSWMIGPQSFTPGMSSTVSTATTPGAARTLSSEIDLMRACARVLMPSAACSVPASSGMSSV
ncbi:hypothetical protein D3C72_1067430 [compost metagenome]